MEKVNTRGRPQAEDPKLHTPRIRLTESSIAKMEELGRILGRTQSEIYQEAVDRYIAHIESIQQIIIRL